jgi:hypothetical protein
LSRKRTFQGSEASPMDILFLCLIIGFFALSWRFVLACKEIEK